MRTLAFDGRMGASGDMVLGALLDAGADRSVLEPVESALDVRYQVGTVERCGISASSVSVLIDDDDDKQPHVEEDANAKGHGHAADHTHEEKDTHAEDGSPPDNQTHAEGHGPHRSYPSVVALVEGMDLPPRVEADTLDIFTRLGQAEANVHGTELEETHFHEVGADDAIADVVGAALLIDDLDPREILTTPLATGGGTVEMSHGVYPVPTPAVLELAADADWTLRGGPLDVELLTPTGAAILAHYADGISHLPSMTLDGSGYGAGSRSFEHHPNVLRVVLGEASGRLTREQITVLETNLDDATPEELGGLQQSLVEAGARDVSILPATMKKSRPGHLVKVVVAPEDAEVVAERLARETGTLGVREHGAGHRWVAERHLETVTVTIAGESYDIGVKVASTGGEVYDVSAEYDDAAAVAETTGLPIRDVMRRAEAIARDEN